MDWLLEVIVSPGSVEMGLGWGTGRLVTGGVALAMLLCPVLFRDVLDCVLTMSSLVCVLGGFREFLNS